MGPIFHGKMVLGAEFYGILVPWWDQKFQARTIFPWKIGPRTYLFGDQFSSDRSKRDIGEFKILGILHLTFERPLIN